MQVSILTDTDACALHVARIVAGVLDSSAASIGLATGATFAPVFAALKDLAPTSARTHLYLLDEYLGLARDDPRSFRNTLTRDVCKPLGIPADRLHGPLNNQAPADEAAKTYEATIVRAGIDVQLLGIGTNGHIGFNEPGTSFASVTRVVALSDRTRADNVGCFGRISDVPTHAITQGIATILRAKRLVLVATGSHKATALARAMLGAVDPECPASAIRLHADVHVIADEAATRSLTSESVDDGSSSADQ